MPIKDKSGVYLITNTVNGYVYVGSSVSLSERFSVHRSRLNLGKHSNPRLQAAWNKYGESSFTFSILEIVESTGESMKDKLLIVEKKWFDHYGVGKSKTCYNILEVPYSSLGRKCTKEQRERMSMAQKKAMSSTERKQLSSRILSEYNKKQKGKPKSESHKQKISDSNLGRKNSPETRRKMSEATKGKPKLSLRGRKASEETREKMRNKVIGEDTRAKMSIAAKKRIGALSTRRRPIIQFSLSDERLNEFHGATDAARIIGVKRTTIKACLTGENKTGAGFIWRYKDVTDEA